MQMCSLLQLTKRIHKQLALHRSLEKYLLIDTSKIGKEDFTQLCHLEDLTAVVVDKNDEDNVQN